MRQCLELDSDPWRLAWLVEVIALAAFLIFAGILASVPGRQWAAFALGLGFILLAKNLVRYLNGIRVRRLGVVLGGGALISGLAGLASPDLPLFGIFLAGTGIALLGLALSEGARRR